MFLDKTIEFSAPDFFIEHNKDNLPTPALENLPDWFKKLKHTKDKRTVKGCKPFLDSLTAGYILKCPTDIRIIKRKHSEKQYSYQFKFPSSGNQYVNINTEADKPFHGKAQMEGSPQLKKNKMDHLFKIYNPFTIKTPKGYSCLFVNPLNNNNDRFEIISGIVDTDSYPGEINFPVVMNNEKYDGEYDYTLERGTPIVQCIPFKRDAWKMKIKPIPKDKLILMFDKLLMTSTSFLNGYAKKWWSKKTWK